MTPRWTTLSQLTIASDHQPQKALLFHKKRFVRVDELNRRPPQKIEKTILIRVQKILTFDGATLAAGVGAGETVAAGLNLDGVVPHVEQVGGGGAAWDWAHSSLQASLSTSSSSSSTTVDTKARGLVGQPVGPNPVLHCY